jgi:hypothetical protein
MTQSEEVELVHLMHKLVCAASCWSMKKHASWGSRLQCCWLTWAVTASRHPEKAPRSACATQQ